MRASHRCTVVIRKSTADNRRPDRNARRRNFRLNAPRRGIRSRRRNANRGTPAAEARDCIRPAGVRVDRADRECLNYAHIHVLRLCNRGCCRSAVSGRKNNRDTAGFHTDNRVIVRVSPRTAFIADGRIIPRIADGVGHVGNRRRIAVGIHRPLPRGNGNAGMRVRA